MAFFSTRRRSIFGLDVGNGGIKLVELQQNRKNNTITLQRFLIQPTPADSIENGLVTDPARLRGALRQLLKDFGARSLAVNTVLTGQSLIVRHVEVPRMSREEFKKVLQLQADTHFGLPTDHLSIDFQIVRELPDNRMLVFLVGSPKQPILDFVDLLKESGFTAKRVDIEPMAALRSLRMTAALTPDCLDATCVVLDLGAGTSNLSIFREDLLQLVRVITVAGNDLTREIANGQGISLQQAEELKRQYGVLPDTPIYEQIRPTFQRLLRQVAMTLEYYQIENRDKPVNYLRVIGGNSKLTGLVDALAASVAELYQRLNMPVPDVALGQPRLSLHQRVNQADAEENGPILAVAIGLALGEVAADATD
ncbi:MAG: type IV pilus assembly protein PilM [Bacillota bacterium]|jgi:type IV pilus assembly protein PilM